MHPTYAAPTREIADPRLGYIRIVWSKHICN